jgi:hypothetical protein
MRRNRDTGGETCVFSADLFKKDRFWQEEKTFDKNVV